VLSAVAESIGYRIGVAATSTHVIMVRLLLMTKLHPRSYDMEYVENGPKDKKKNVSKMSSGSSALICDTTKDAGECFSAAKCTCTFAMRGHRSAWPFISTYAQALPSAARRACDVWLGRSAPSIPKPFDVIFSGIASARTSDPGASVGRVRGR
jgi:hypothetical protein